MSEVLLKIIADVTDLREQLDNIERRELASFTAGRVAIVGAAGGLTDDDGLTYNAVTNALAVAGALSVGAALSVVPTAAGGTSGIEIGTSGTGNRVAYLDLTGDDTYTDYGVRLVRNATGANTTSDIQHRGTGALRLMALDDGSVVLFANGSERFRVNGTGVGFNAAAPIAKPAVVALTKTLGTAVDAIPDAAATYTAANIDNMVKSLATKINAIRTVLLNYGLVT